MKRRVGTGSQGSPWEGLGLESSSGMLCLAPGKSTVQRAQRASLRGYGFCHSPGSPQPRKPMSHPRQKEGSIGKGGFNQRDVGAVRWEEEVWVSTAWQDGCG